MDREQTLGGRLREVREERRIPQDDVARAARRVGLSWTRSTVAKIEAGQRELRASELLVLPWILSVSLEDLMPTRVFADFGFIKWPSDSLREVVGGGPPAPLAGPHETPGVATPGEADEKAARALRVSIDTVLVLALELWDLSLTGERERRLAARLGPGPHEDARSVQAVRGRITRELLAELRAALSAHPATAAKERAR